MTQRGRRRPSASLVVSIVALVVAMSGTAIAAGRLVDGDRLIRKDSLSGNRLRRHTLTAAEINLARLGTVPSAVNALHAGTAVSATSAADATNASNATNAANAQNAAKLGGQSASSYLTSTSIVGTKGIIKASASASGHVVPLLSSGPFTLSMTCTSSSTGNSVAFTATSTEANADLAGNFAAANTPTDLYGYDFGPTPTAYSEDGIVLDFEAPSGAQLIVVGGAGVESLGADCWANFSGVS